MKAKTNQIKIASILRVLVLLQVLAFAVFIPPAQAQINATNYLDISIRIFDPPPPPVVAVVAENPGIDKPVIDISPEIRLTESRYLPMFLRFRLEDSGLFGAVRVLPALDQGAQLMIEGQVKQSDGATLEVAIVARDSTGRIWIDKTYVGTAVESVALNESPTNQDPFGYLYSELVRDLGGKLQELTQAQIIEIRTVALLRFGYGLAPQFFTDYLQESATGTVTISRLPAGNDPLLQRIEQIREHEFLFIDVVDQEFQKFFTEIKPVYDMWRKFRREQTESASNFETRETTTQSQFSRGSYYALQESYNNYRWAKIQALYLDELSEGFANEVEPTQIELQDSLYKLTGTFEQQYREWRSILAELLALETQ